MTCTSALQPVLATPQRHVPPPVHLRPIGTRGRDGGRAYPLAEDLAEQGAARLQTLPAWLDVEGQPRYLRHPKKTWCNIYAHDFAYMCRVYLPRVWWMSPLEATEKTRVKYNKTVRELSARMMYEWLREWGPHYGWEIVETDTNDTRGPGWLQEKLDEPGTLRLGVICVHRTTRGSGHVSIALPQRPCNPKGSAFIRDGEVIAPLQSQAGAHNHRLFAKSWWRSRDFDRVIFGWVDIPQKESDSA